ncbi:MAG: S-adenosylmethionine decarboxylase proenzyme [Alphaproteobacteria bacterium MarineAlpha4_Bin2]|nr:MAG: S-adenosylmethionine decarboxylase proenzyme [Alphaproteobacteria bacterium MarineAlpha4_Bin2]
MDRSNLPTLFDTQAEEAEVGKGREFLLHHEGACYAGRHLLIDVWDGERLRDADVIDDALRRGAESAGATLLHVHLHEFSENGGVSGVAVLAESHISIHTWPEYDYAAIDVFMCGGTDPMKAVDILREAFKPGRLEIFDHYRGRIC